MLCGTYRLSTHISRYCFKSTSPWITLKKNNNQLNRLWIEKRDLEFNKLNSRCVVYRSFVDILHLYHLLWAPYSLNSCGDSHHLRNVFLVRKVCVSVRFCVCVWLCMVDLFWLLKSKLSVLFAWNTVLVKWYFYFRDDIPA